MKIEIKRIERPSMSDTPRIPVVITFSDEKTAGIRSAEIDVYLNRDEAQGKTLEAISEQGLFQAYKFLEDILSARPD